MNDGGYSGTNRSRSHTIVKWSDISSLETCVVWRISSSRLWRIQFKMCSHLSAGLPSVFVLGRTCLLSLEFLYIRGVSLIKVEVEVAQNYRTAGDRIAEFQQVRKFFKEYSETQLVFSTGWRAVQAKHVYCLMFKQNCSMYQFKRCMIKCKFTCVLNSMGY